MATPNMGLVLPAVGVTVGPLWASELNTALEAVDAHDHTNGNGLPITPEALNIDSPVDFQGYGLQAVDQVELVSKAATVATPGAVYAVSGDLWYTNASGTAVQITVGGVIAGAAGSISGLVAPASASYDTGTTSFRWNANATTRASLDAGALILRSAGGITAQSINLSAPAAGVTTYTLQFPPTAPATVSRFLFTSTAGVSSWVQPDASTVEVSGTTLRVKDLGITTAKLADNNVTGAKIGLGANGVLTANINDAAITGAKIATGANGVATANIVDNAVTTAKIAGNNVTGAKIGLGANGVLTANINDAAVTGAKIGLGANGVATANIVDNAVTGAKIGLGANGVLTANINDAAVTGAKIGLGANGVATANIVDNAVTGAKIGLGVNGVATANVVDNAITGAKIGLGSSGVLTANINDAAVTGAKIGLGANGVLTANINDAAVTGAKIATGANGVATANIVDLAVTTAKIAAGAVNGSTGVTMDKLSPRHTVAAFVGGPATYQSTSYVSFLTASIACAAGNLRINLQPTNGTDDYHGLQLVTTIGSNDNAMIKLEITGAETFTYIWTVIGLPNADCYAPLPAVSIRVAGGTYTATWYVKNKNASDSWKIKDIETVLTQG